MRKDCRARGLAGGGSVGMTFRSSQLFATENERSSLFLVGQSFNFALKVHYLMVTI